MKMPCKLRREGWKEADKAHNWPEEVTIDDMVDVIFWNDVRGANPSPPGGWAWGWDEPRGYRIKYWRFTPK